MAGLNIQSVDALSPLAVAGLNLSTMAGGMVAGLAITFGVMKSSMFRPGIPIGVAINAKKQEQLDTWVKEHPRLEGIVQNWQGQNRHGKITTREFGEIEETVSDLKRVRRPGP